MQCLSELASFANGQVGERDRPREVNTKIRSGQNDSRSIIKACENGVEFCLPRKISRSDRPGGFLWHNKLPPTLYGRPRRGPSYGASCWSSWECWRWDRRFL